MNKAYSVLEIKSASDGDLRTFTGIASTPSPDREEDVVEPKGAVFKLPIPLLWQHDSSDPIGWITRAKVTSAGIEVEGKIADVEDDGVLKSRLSMAWQMIKSGLVRGLSIGFNPLEQAEIAGSKWGRRYTKWEWLELSAVTIPANQEASIVTVKAASGHNKSTASGLIPKENIMKTLHEQLAELKEARALKAARLAEISEGIKQKTASVDDNVEFDGLMDEIAELDNDIRIKHAEVISAGSARPVASSTKTAPTILIRKDREEDFKGQNYTRMVIAKALAAISDDGSTPINIAERRWGKTNPTLVNIMKAAVAGGGSGSGEWGAELVTADNRYTGDFIDLIKAKTVYDRLPLREVPANVQIKGQDGAATGYWVGESAAIPASAASFNNVNLAPLKVAALAVVSNELLRDSSPAAEALIRDALVSATAQRIDQTFLSATAAVAGVSPAGILNGLTAGTASGTGADDLRADIRTLYAAFLSAKTANNLHFICNPSLAKSIQLLFNSLGMAEFPGITQAGGSLLGDPVVTGDNVASDNLILLNPSEIYKIGDMGLQVSISREAMIEMDDAPEMDSENPTTASGSIVSMFQTESTAIKVVRPINFALRRTASSVVGYMDGAAYDDSAVVGG